MEITIRSVQHYLYCPHRWGLLEIDRAWAENVFVTKANLMHKRVHDPDRNYSTKDKKVFTSVSVYNDSEEYDLYGVADCIEATESPDGICLPGLPGKYDLCIVEYKPTKPKNGEYREDDLMQVFAQKVCVDHVFGCDCKGVLYYADVKKRYPLPLQENYQIYDAKLKSILNDMRSRLETGCIPPIAPKQYCSGCSLKDVCMPHGHKQNDVRHRIYDIEAIRQEEEQL